MEDKICKTFTKQIGKLTRTLNVYQYEWGIKITIIDEIPNVKNKTINVRCFKYTKNFPTLDSLIDRALNYSKIK